MGFGRPVSSGSGGRGPEENSHESPPLHPALSLSLSPSIYDDGGARQALEAANEVGDADTAAMILTQLSNLYEHEVPGGAAAAAVARTDLARIMTEAFHRSAPDTCSICLDAMVRVPRLCVDRTYPSTGRAAMWLS